MAVGKYVNSFRSAAALRTLRERYCESQTTVALMVVFLQEQETFQGQEGPQEEDRRPLLPQGLVRHQGTIDARFPMPNQTINFWLTSACKQAPAPFNVRE